MNHWYLLWGKIKRVASTCSRAPRDNNAQRRTSAGWSGDSTLQREAGVVLQAGRVQSGTKVRQSCVVVSSSLVKLLLGPSERPPPTHCDRSEVSFSFLWCPTTTSSLLSFWDAIQICHSRIMQHFSMISYITKVSNSNCQRNQKRRKYAHTRVRVFVLCMYRDANYRLIH